jgi:NADH-quinone oxidoreductase subunit C
MQQKDLSRRYAALAGAIEAKLKSGIERLPTSTGELGYRVAPESLLEVCRTLRDQPELKFEILIDVCGVDYHDYGKDEWQTTSATGTGFSRGTLRDTDAAAVDAAKHGAKYVAARSNGGTPRETGAVSPHDAEQHARYRPAGRFAVVYHLLSITHNHRLRLKVFCASDERPIVDSVYDVWNSSDWFEREAFDLYGILFRGHPDLRRLLTDYGFIGHPFRKDFPLIGNVEMRYDPAKGRVVYEPVGIEPRTLVPKVIRDDARYDPDLTAKDPGSA